MLRYADYAVWQREMLADEARMEPHLVYWREALGGELPVLELQTDRPRPAVMTSNGGKVDVVEGANAAAGLGAVCQQCGTTMMRGVLAAWAVVLGKHSGQEEIVVGVPYANREHSAVHDIVGFFVSTLAVRVQVNGKQNCTQMVKAAAHTVSEALMHAEVPFMRVVEEVAPVREASRTPVYQTMLTWEEASGWGDAADTMPDLVEVSITLALTHDPQTYS